MSTASTPAVIHYEGTFKGSPVSGDVPVWSIPKSPADVARLVYVVITGEVISDKGVEWSCGVSDFRAFRLEKPLRSVRPGQAPFLSFTFTIERAKPAEVSSPEPVAAPLTMAPTFADEIPEPAFDILSDLSGNGARSVIIYRAPYMDCVDYVSSPLDPMSLRFPKMPGDVIAWQLFETLDGWRWWKTGEFKRHDSAGLFLP